MERLRGKFMGEIKGKITAIEKRKYEKLLKANTTTESRSLEILIQEFEASAGDFDAFHSGMNGREKLLFKAHIGAMRDNPV
jgi:hypothetical protein